jgi:spoIIIJ-associated protein
VADEPENNQGEISEEMTEAAARSVEEIAEVARDLYQTIADGMGVEAEIRLAGIEGSDIHLNALGDEEDGGLLIGRRGQTLEAIQTLIAAIMARKTSRKIRVFVDAFGYHERRAESLRQMARDVAEQVVAAGQEALTEPLNAAERRIIHTALQDWEGVITYSEGAEPNRYVVISPADDGDAETEE